MWVSVLRALRLALSRLLTDRRAYAGWYDSVYDEELGSQPCIFTSVTPVRAAPVCAWVRLNSVGQAWNNVNLVRLAEKIKSPLVL